MGKKGKLKEAIRASKGRPSAFDAAPVTRKRHNVVGQKSRGKAKSQQQARSTSDSLRRDTLLVEHQQRGSKNAFVDGRFGEDDESMPHEDRMVHRFQRERQRQIRQSRYGLADGDEAAGGSLGAVTELTHGGRAVGDIEEFSDIEPDPDDGGGRSHARGGGGGGWDDEDFVRRAHFGGGEGAEGERRLSAKELERETIAKYKLEKYERQEARSAEQKALAKLDDDFDEIRGLVFSADKQLKNEKKAAEPKAKAAAAYADYEKLAAQMKREVRAAPADRLQTEEELASAEAKRLRTLEQERLLRMRPDGAGGMRGPTDDDLVGNFEPLPGVGGEEEGAGAGPSAAEGIDEEEEEEEEDDEDDDDDDDDEEEEDDEEEGGKVVMGGVAEAVGDDDEADDDDDADEVDDEDSEEEEEEDGGGGGGGGGVVVEEDDDDEEIDVDEYDEYEDDDEEDAVVIQPKRRAASTAASSSAPAPAPPAPVPADDIPYVFACPSTSAELDELLDGVAAGHPSSQRTVLHRLIAGAPRAIGAAAREPARARAAHPAPPPTARAASK